MARPPGASGHETSDAIRRAGLQLIYAHGYEAMSLRQLAAEVGLVQGSLYNHFATKQELLYSLISEHLEEVLKNVDRALDGLEEPSRRLQAFVAFHVSYHVDLKQMVFISYSELRSLTPENYDKIVDMRRTYEGKLVNILRDGAEQGIFRIADATTSAFGILSMLSGICSWYDPNGRLSKSQISEIFEQMVRGAVFDRTLTAGEIKTSVKGAKMR